MWFFLSVSIPILLSFIYAKESPFTVALATFIFSALIGLFTTFLFGSILHLLLYKRVTKKAQACYVHALDETYTQLCSPQNMSVFINDTQKLTETLCEKDKQYLNQLIQSIKIAFVENEKSSLIKYKSSLIQDVRRITSYYFKMFPQDENGQYLENIDKQFNQAVFQSEKELQINSHASDLKQYL